MTAESTCKPDVKTVKLFLPESLRFLKMQKHLELFKGVKPKHT